MQRHGLVQASAGWGLAVAAAIGQEGARLVDEYESGYVFFLNKVQDCTPVAGIIHKPLEEEQVKTILDNMQAEAAEKEARQKRGEVG